MSELSSPLSRPMNWLLSLLVAVLTGIVGLLTSGIVAIAYVEWYYVSSFEGASGYFIVGIALLGGIISSVLGLIIARIVASGANPGFWKALAFSSGSVLGIGGLAALLFYVFAGNPSTIIDPGLAQAEYEAAQAVAEQAVFDAIAPDSPIRAWLPYTSEWQEEKRRAVAIEHITSRAGFPSELGGVMLDTDPRQAEAALRFVSRLPTPDAALVPAVTAVGHDLIVRMNKVNATTPEQDPGYEGAADISIRFNAWMEAVRALREKAQGDFIPELGEILELSRVRIDSQVMQQDVRRVAGYYMKIWADVEPLPGDPPPK